MGDFTDLNAGNQSKTNALSDSTLEFLLSAEAVRDRAEKILALCQKGEGEFEVHLERLSQAADLVVQVIKEKYPTLKIPYHSRFNHFHVGGIDRMKALNDLIKNETPEERARIKVDLCVTSVLLDAGAGDNWKYNEGGHLYSRSEGLAVASYNMFMKGIFSAEPRTIPLRADFSGLMHITEEHINTGFQVSISNPLLGVKGRAELLHRLGKAVESQKEIFDGGRWCRPGHLVDYLLRTRPAKKVEATYLLKTVLKGFGSIWPGRIVYNDVNLGDTWRHPKLGEGTDSFVPLHKLSQWLTYSLLDPLEELGFTITGLNELTGLAEYRNGGLFFDMQVIVPRSEDYKTRSNHPDSKFIIEWRALTVALLDRVAVLVCDRLKLSQEQFPLAKVLEGGTWWAGRRLAQEKRKGKPPFEIFSDGTVF